MMTKRAKWGVTAAILLMIAGMIAYPQLKNKFKASQDAASVVPTSGTSLRNQTLNINAEVLKYQSLTDKIMSTGSTLPDEEVDLAFESSGKVVAIYFTEGSHVKAGDLLAKINDKPLQAQLKKLEAQVPLAKDRVYRQRTLLEKDGMMQNYKATVYAVESKVDMATRTLKVRATYPNPGENILPGRYTSVEISKREIKDALAIPSEAVIPEMGKDIVYLYKNGVAEPQEITIGIRTESRVQVLQGLNVGDTLITSGVMQLRTGMKVSIDNLTE